MIARWLRHGTSLRHCSGRSLSGIVTLMLLMSVCGFCLADNPRSTLKEADALFAERKFDRARSLYERALAEGARFDNDLPRARNFGLACLDSTPPDLANGIKWLRVALALDPQQDGLRARLAASLLRTGDADGAIENYRILVGPHPQSAEYVVSLSSALRQAGRADEGIELLRTTVEKFPSLVPVRVEYARQLNFSKRFPEAKRQFQAVLAVDPDNVIAQVGVAKATSFEGDQETAIAMYDRILARHPGLYDAIVGKAFSLLWSGRTAQARPLLDEGLRRHPQDPELRQAWRDIQGPAAGLVPGPPSQEREHPAQTAKPAIQPTPPRPLPEKAALTESRQPTAGRSQPAPLPSRTPEPARRANLNFYLFIAGPAIAAIVLLLAYWNYRRRTGIGPGEQAPALENSIHLVNAPAPRPPVPYQEQLREAEPIAMPGTEKAIAAPAPKKILLVGGSETLVELESRWLILEDLEIISEAKWVPAAVRLLNDPPDILVLNATTADGWTSMRMFEWLAANRPHICRRAIVVISNSAEPGQLDPEAHYLFEPFCADDWVHAVQSIINPPGSFAKLTAEVDSSGHHDETGIV